MKWASGKAALILGLSLMGCEGSVDGAAQGGGMDGGGSIAIGVDGLRLVTLQQIWEGDELRYLVINRGPETAEVAVSDGKGGQLAAWEIPAHSTRAFDGSALLGNSLSLELNGFGWGILESPKRPTVSTTFPVVSNENMNGGQHLGAQIETDFSVASGSSFHAQVSLTGPGELTIAKQPFNTAEARYLEVLAVRSETGSVTTSSTHFTVLATSRTEPTRVELELGLPDGFAGEPLVAINAGGFCTDFVSLDVCGSGVGLVRAVPLAAE